MTKEDMAARLAELDALIADLKDDLENFERVDGPVFARVWLEKLEGANV